MMTALAHAEIEHAVAIQQGQTLTIVVQGYTSGFGGTLEIWRNPAKILPPLFDVFAVPGNDGINPDASPKRVPTIVAASFPGYYPEIQLAHADGRFVLKSIKVKREDPEAYEGGLQQLSTLVSTATDDTLPGPLARRCEQVDVGWIAIHNLMPPGPAKLWVQGVLMMPTPGYKLKITEASPQGINPTILLLDLEIKKPSGVQIQVMTPTVVRFDKVTETHYDKVHVRPINEIIDVQEVH